MEHSAVYTAANATAIASEALVLVKHETNKNPPHRRIFVYPVSDVSLMGFCALDEMRSRGLYFFYYAERI